MALKVGDKVRRPTTAEDSVLGAAMILAIHRDSAWVVYAPKDPESDHWRYRSVDLADLEKV